MFDLLKKKFSNFIGSITKKEKEENNVDEDVSKHGEEQSRSSQAKVEEQLEVREKQPSIEEDRRHTMADEPKRNDEHRNETRKDAHAHIEQKETSRESEKPVHLNRNESDLEPKERFETKVTEQKSSHESELHQDDSKKEDMQKVAIKEQHIEHVQKTAGKAQDRTGIFAPEEKKGILGRIFERKPKENITETHRELTKHVQKVERQQIAQEEEKRPETHHNISLETKIKGLVFGTVEIKEKDVKEILEEFKMALLESDVNYEVAEKMVDTMQKKLVGSKVNSRSIEIEIRRIIRDSVSEVLRSNSNIDIVERAKAKREQSQEPFTILFIGPNGAGKTTTMGKLASMMLKNGLTCVLSASDTFRAAAIEQTAIHAQRLGINVVKGIYGADPASIAFDAIAYAKARKIDVVLVDSAGRQETNKNLIEEMKKMVRVAKPDMKIFIGESIAGNSLMDQVRTFDAAIKLDGIILTKLDVDAKGGNTISILSETTIPVLFFGIGEAYDSLVPYDQKMVLDNIVPI